MKSSAVVTYIHVSGWGVLQLATSKLVAVVQARTLQAFFENDFHLPML